MKTIEVHYSFRDYREVEVTLPDDADHDDEEAIRAALEKQTGMTFSEDEEWQMDGAYEL